MQTTIIRLLPFSMLLFVTGCTTVTGPDGQQHSAMTPLGAAAVQTVSASAIGAGVGALMPHMNSVAAGAISAGAGSVGSQAINAFIPKAESGQQSTAQQASKQQNAGPLYRLTSEGNFVPAKIRYVQQPDGSYVPSYPQGVRLFKQLPNGSFAPVN